MQLLTDLIRTAHFVGMALLCGSVATWAFWISRAVDHRRPGPQFTFVLENILRSDNYFTSPGAAMVGLSGVLMVAFSKLGTPQEWVVPKSAAFIATGLIWRFALIPAQRNMIRLVTESAGNGELPAEFHHMRRRWLFFGFLNYLLLLGIIGWSVLAPH